MIEPAYRRDQLWSRRLPGVPAPIIVGAIMGVALTLLVAVAALPADRDYVFIDDSPRTAAEMIVTKLAAESFPAWHEHHAGCPHRLSELLPDVHLDPWGHALHYTCDPRLAPGRSFAVFSAGEDGVFGTSDDIAAIDSIAAP